MGQCCRTSLNPSLRTALLLALLALALLQPARAFATAFQVSPTRFQFPLDRRFTNFFTVTNNSGQDLRLRVVTAFVDFDAEDRMIERADDPRDLGRWMVFNPRRMTLPAGEKRVVRFTVRPPAGLPPGEYRTVVFFEELPERPDDRPAPATESGIRIRLLTRVGITVYGQNGTIAPDVKLQEFAVAVQPAGLAVVSLLANTGNEHGLVAVTAELLDATGAVQSNVDEHVTVQPDQQRRLTLQLPRPAPGRYRLRLSGNSGDRPWFQSEQPVTVDPPTK